MVYLHPCLATLDHFYVHSLVTYMQAVSGDSYCLVLQLNSLVT
jgi:hypothetical protein